MVWNTTQSALYESERRCDKRSACAGRAEEKHDDGRNRCSPHNKRKSMLDDGDALLILMLLMVLIKEKSDQTLIFALLIALLM